MRIFEEIASREDANRAEIALYPEGLFYKAYERSAFAFVTRISAFKPSKKRIKYLGRDIVSIGFPAGYLTRYFPAPPQALSDGRLVIPLDEAIDAAAFEAWKSSLPLKEPRARTVPAAEAGLAELHGAPCPVAGSPQSLQAGLPKGAGEASAERIVRMIRDFRLESATPVQCVMFIAELKQRIDGDL